MNKDKIKSIFETNGQKGLARFTIDNFLKDKDGNLMYICSDTSRNIFKYKDCLGDIQKDVKAIKLISQLIESGLVEINTKISIDSWTKSDGTSEINSLSSDNTLFLNELSSRTVI